MGPAGPKESIVKTALGIFGLACIEGTRAWFVDIIPAGAPLREKFAASVAGESLRFTSADGRHDLIIAVRREFPEFDMPERTAEQRRQSARFWGGEFERPDKVKWPGAFAGA